MKKVIFWFLIIVIVFCAIGKKDMLLNGLNKVVNVVDNAVDKVGENVNTDEVKNKISNELKRQFTAK